LVCSKAKHHCIGAVWGNWEGVSGGVIGVPSGLKSGDLKEMRELMWKMVELQEENCQHVMDMAVSMCRMMYVVENQLQEVLDSFQCMRDPKWDNLDYEEWLEVKMKVGDLDGKLSELQAEEAEFEEWLRERAEKRRGVATEVVVEAEEVVVELGAGL
jgi:hypothetical protein